MNNLSSSSADDDFDPAREPVQLGSAMDDLFAGWGK